MCHGNLGLSATRSVGHLLVQISVHQLGKLLEHSLPLKQTHWIWNLCFSGPYQSVWLDPTLFFLPIWSHTIWNHSTHVSLVLININWQNHAVLSLYILLHHESLPVLHPLGAWGFESGHKSGCAEKGEVELGRHNPLPGRWNQHQFFGQEETTFLTLGRKFWKGSEAELMG